jgi:hypothetical protein
VTSFSRCGKEPERRGRKDYEGLTDMTIKYYGFDSSKYQTKDTLVYRFKIWRIFFIITIFLYLLNCVNKEMNFNKAKWNAQTGGFYKYRENMVNDLMKTYLRKGMTYVQVTELIGIPENNIKVNENTVVYEIMQNFGTDIDPIETKYLKIEITKDSLVKSYILEHWKKNNTVKAIN